MRFCLGILGAFLMLTGTAAAQPTIEKNSVTNAASYIGLGLPSHGVAQGGMFIVKGKNLGAAGVRTATSFPLQTTMGGPSIKITVGGTTVDALMVYVVAGRGGNLPDQLAAIAPSNTPVGDGTLTVTYNNQTSAAAAIRIVRRAFGIFTINQAGSGPAVVTTAEYAVNTLTAVARPQQALIIWGTGLGAITGGNEAGPPPFGNLADSSGVEVLVGGKRATIVAMGRSGCCAGVDQIAFQVPDGVEGCYVPLVVRTGGVTSNFGSISVARTGTVCSDPAGISGTELEALAGKAEVRVGNISLDRSSTKMSLPPPFGTFESKGDSGSGSFLRYQAAQIVAAQSLFGSAAFGACMVFTYSPPEGGELTQVPEVEDPVKGVWLDAGAALTVSGPKGQKQMPRQRTEVPGSSPIISYSAQLGGGSPLPLGPPPQPDYLDPGAYTITGPGGPDIGAFSVSLNLPTPFTTNLDSINEISRAQDLRITWTGGDPNTYVTMQGFSTSQTAGGFFICTERTSARQFDVPSWVLSVLPPSATVQGVTAGFLTVANSGNPVRFNASGCDYCTAGYSFSSMKMVAYK